MTLLSVMYEFGAELIMNYFMSFPQRLDSHTGCAASVVDNLFAVHPVHPFAGLTDVRIGL